MVDTEDTPEVSIRIFPNRIVVTVTHEDTQIATKTLHRRDARFWVGNTDIDDFVHRVRALPHGELLAEALLDIEGDTQIADAMLGRK